MVESLDRDSTTASIQVNPVVPQLVGRRSAVVQKTRDIHIQNQHVHAWLNSRLCSVTPSNLSLHWKRTHEYGYANVYLEFYKLDVWFMPNDPKGSLLNGLLPPGVAEFAGVTMRSVPGRMLVASLIPVNEAEHVAKSLGDYFEIGRRRGYMCDDHGYVRGAPRLPYYETDRTMGSLSQKPPYDHITDARHRDFDQLWMYFVHNDLIPIYDPISGVRTWRMEMLYNSHLNRLIDDFFLKKWHEPDQVRRRYFEISADLRNECTYGLIAFSDITQRQTLASGDCPLTQEWIDDVLLLGISSCSGGDPMR